eukprot:gb/GFBE01009734.1/.p1 GENE.gb/GFBE01009734.1/~~gb/GFBE01009734.1/.p1  ORF type:complete len:211 (+),score=42.94 gb/GFBE01009734.1/:1-633(+)
MQSAASELPEEAKAPAATSCWLGHGKATSALPPCAGAFSTCSSAEVERPVSASSTRVSDGRWAAGAGSAACRRLRSLSTLSTLTHERLLLHISDEMFGVISPSTSTLEELSAQGNASDDASDDVSDSASSNASDDAFDSYSACSAYFEEWQEWEEIRSRPVVGRLSTWSPRSTTSSEDRIADAIPFVDLDDDDSNELDAPTCGEVGPDVC